MIVKIQRSQPPTTPGQVLIYSRSGYFWCGEIDPYVNEWLGDRQKAYAHARLEGTEMVIEKTAKYQDW